ncbi:MAG TPA: hypothetical protein DET46_05300 [Comamonadaceae bacterium]|jgi:hypothetical protein|nr:hypothetical protein [Burkholderiaceae bacterium]OGA91284.1 MAG: hypothetical protein A2Z55_03545 [Burkholderiales bacterium RIFCSPHIGHO2_12_63_9]OGB45388.1 MAG: hypothetical protein A3F76_16435 [Burkholderiales bacterium RIFCSPLOWO2_12_FULL_65_40]HCE28255.1 hypothetical protein [Comamonadaceae bacterium]
MFPKEPAMPRRILLAVALVSLLAGCDKISAIPGLGPDPRIAQREEEAKAIGGACRHALRGLEDCYMLNPKANKAAVFTGWKDMDQYMRDNKIEGTPSVISAPAKPAASDNIETESRSTPASKKS